MRRPTRIPTIWLATLPITWALIGCGGGDKETKKSPAPKAPVTSEGATPAKEGASQKRIGEEAAGTSTAAASEGWGSIKGRIVYDGTPPEPVVLAEQGAKTMKDGKEVKNFERCTQHALVSDELVVNKDNKGIQWAAAYLIRPASIHPDLKNPPAEPAELGQQFCMFKPHVMAMREGQKLKVTASDPGVAHNTKVSGLKNAGFNKMLQPPAGEGEKAEMGDVPDLVTENLPLKVECNIHSWMSARIFVLDHPYIAITDDTGVFEIKNVPAGKVKLAFWHEKWGYGEGGRNGKEIDVKAGETSDIGQTVFPPPK